MAQISINLRMRLVEVYRSKRSGTYSATAALFGVSEATVGRILRRFRQTGDVRCRRHGGHHPRRIDLQWLSQDLVANPARRLIDRVEAWERQSGKRVSVATMWLAARDCGWTLKKKRRSLSIPTPETSGVVESVCSSER
jgi:transposase